MGKGREICLILVYELGQIGLGRRRTVAENTVVKTQNQQREVRHERRYEQA